GTFALGSQALYAWLHENPVVRMLPVGAVNDPALMRKLRRFVSVNGALAIDLSGQVAADHVGGRQYSGVGGHEAFVMGAGEAPGGRTIVCLKSTATVRGERISTIVPALPAGTRVPTPRPPERGCRSASRSWASSATGPASSRRGGACRASTPTGWRAAPRPRCSASSGWARADRRRASAGTHVSVARQAKQRLAS